MVGAGRIVAPRHSDGVRALAAFLAPECGSERTLEARSVAVGAGERGFWPRTFRGPEDY